MSRMLVPALIIAVLGGLLAVAIPQPAAVAHCQVPCGIYDDTGRITHLLEDATTITKAIAQINELSQKSDALSMNQATRWILTKEQHASHIITTVSEYFLTQKVKDIAPDAEGYAAYLASLAVHHKVMRVAMKAKQTVDAATATELTHALEALGKLYQ